MLNVSVTLDPVLVKGWHVKSNNYELTLTGVMVTYRTLNPRVEGSNPSLGTNMGV